MAVFFTVLCGIAVVTLGYFSYYFTRGHFVHSTEAAIDSEIRHAISWDEQGAEDLARALSVPERIWLLQDMNGNYLGGSLRALPENVSLLTEGIIIFEHGQRQYAAKIHSFSDGRKLLIGIDFTDLSQSYRFMQRLSILSIILMFAVIITSYAISRFVVTRTNKIAETARNIMETGDMSQRIALHARWDDLGFMAGVLNEFLARIENLMASVRQVADNIAHDLRTPLSRMRSSVEELKNAPSLAQNKEAQNLCDKISAEADRLLDTFNALLKISRIEEGRDIGPRHPLDLENLAQDVAELYEPLAEEKNINLQKNLQKALYNGNKDLLFQALANIVDNAIKFTPAGGTVTITSGQDNKGHVFVSICDSGPGINETDESRLFKRFYRAESSRRSPGNGLGLSLVSAIVTSHGGTVTLENIYRNAGTSSAGLCATIFFPAET